MKITSGRSYQSRAWFLKKLGFGSYSDYLASELWRGIRERVFEIKGHSCYCCGRYATQAHHTRYHENDLLGNTLRFIHPICATCHREVEFDDGAKATLLKAKQRFKRKRRRLLRPHDPKVIGEFSLIYGYLKQNNP